MPEQMTVILKELFPISLWDELYRRASQHEHVYTSHVFVSVSGEVTQLITTPDWTFLGPPLLTNSNANHHILGIEGVL